MLEKISKVQLRMNSPEIQSTLDTRHTTKTNKT